MPIEPASVSKNSVREVEKTTPSFSLWTSKQGSSTGGKDSPSNSIWEKAINGAQKLLGLDKSEPSERDEPNEAESRASEDVSSGTTPGFNSVNGFGNRSFGSFSGSAFGGDTFGSVSTSRTSTEMFETYEAPIDDFQRSEYADTRESAAARSDRSHSEVRNLSSEEAESTEESSENEDEKVTSRVRPLARPPLVASSLETQNAGGASQLQSSATAATTQNVVQQASANAASPESSVQANQITNASEAASPVKQQVPQATVASNSQATPNAGVSVPSNGTQKTVTEPVAQSTQAESAKSALGLGQPQTATNSAQATTANSKPTEVKSGELSSTQLEKPIAETAKPVTGSVVAKSEQTSVADNVTAKPVAPAVTNASVQAEKADQVNVSGSPASRGSESLEVNPAKAKEIISDTFARLEKQQEGAKAPTPTSQSTAQRPQVTSTVANADAVSSNAAKATGTENIGIRSTDTASVEGKEISVEPETAKREVQAHNRPAVANGKLGNPEAAMANSANRVSSETTMSDVKLSSGAQSQVASQTGANAREASTVVASKVQPNANAKQGANASGQANQGVSGVSGTGTANASLAAQGSRQNSGQQGGSDASAKQELGDALKQSTSAKTADKSGADSSQPFESKMESATSTRRSEAASKTRQTSYVSKTAEEVKEVVATLTKSIDRLVSTKPGTMNLKINFEGGGSLNLRVSMDGNQVSTSMQTDVAGLETAIKSNWSELANDWNQKGVKLNVPHFQNSETASNRGNGDDFNEFAQRGDRNAESRGTFGEGRGRSRSAQSNRGFASAGSTNDVPEMEPQTSNGSARNLPNQELKTYA